MRTFDYDYAPFAAYLLGIIAAAYREFCSRSCVEGYS